MSKKIEFVAEIKKIVRTAGNKEATMTILIPSTQSGEIEIDKGPVNISITVQQRSMLDKPADEGGQLFPKGKRVRGDRG